MCIRDRIYAVQISENFLETPPAAGSVVKIGAFNQPYPVLSGIPIPNDIAFDLSLIHISEPTRPY